MSGQMQRLGIFWGWLWRETEISLRVLVKAKILDPGLPNNDGHTPGSFHGAVDVCCCWP